MKRILAVTLLAVSLLVATPTSAFADHAPTVTLKYAREMNCKWPEHVHQLGGGRNDGVTCVARNDMGRTEFVISRYENIVHATDYWRDWLSYYSEDGDRPGYFVKRGRVIITDQ